MYLTLFDKEEAYRNLFYDKRINIYNKCGKLLVDILNNQDKIKENINKFIKEIEKSKKPLDSLEWDDYKKSNKDKRISAKRVSDTQRGVPEEKLNSNLYEDETEDIRISDIENEKSIVLNNFYDLVSFEFLKLEDEQVSNRNKRRVILDYSAEIEKGEKYEITSNILFEKQIEYLNDLLIGFKDICNIVEEHSSSSTYDKKDIVLYSPPSKVFWALFGNNNGIDTLYLLNEQLENGANIKRLTMYEIFHFVELFRVYVILILDKKICIKKCKNCHKYFLTVNRTDEIYCQNISPQNINKTCQEYGRNKAKETHIKSNTIKYEHIRTRQCLYMRVRRTIEKGIDNKSIKALEKCLANYKKEYTRKSKLYNVGRLSESKFVEWIIAQK